MTGERRTGNSPSTTCKSVRHTPHALTFKRSSPSPASGASTSASSSGRAPTGAGVLNRQALIVVLLRRSNPRRRDTFALRRGFGSVGANSTPLQVSLEEFNNRHGRAYAVRRLAPPVPLVLEQDVFDRHVPLPPILHDLLGLHDRDVR